MKKVFLIALTAVFALLCGCDKPQNPEPQQRQLQLLKEEMHYTSDGSPYYKNTYSYDSSGRMVKREHILYPSGDFEGTSYTESFSYNEHGHLVSFVTTEAYNSSMNYAYTYNDDGSVSAYEMSDGTNSRKILFEYDDSGRFLCTYYLDKDGNRQMRYSCAYDTAGKITEISYLGVNWNHANFEYDDQGRVVKSFSEGWIEYSYDGDKRISENRTSFRMHWTYSYSDGILSGIVLETEDNSKFGEFAARSYTLNEFGYITKVQYDGGGWIEYTYEDWSGSDEPILRYWNDLNEPWGIKEAYQDVMAYVLPGAREYLD